MENVLPPCVMYRVWCMTACTNTCSEVRVLIFVRLCGQTFAQGNVACVYAHLMWCETTSWAQAFSVPKLPSAGPFLDAVPPFQQQKMMLLPASARENGPGWAKRHQPETQQELFLEGMERRPLPASKKASLGNTRGKDPPTEEGAPATHVWRHAGPVI